MCVCMLEYLLSSAEFPASLCILTIEMVRRATSSREVVFGPLVYWRMWRVKCLEHSWHPLPNCSLPARIALRGDRKKWAAGDLSPRQWIIITIECWLGSSSSSFTGGGWRWLRKELGRRSWREVCDESQRKYCFVQGIPQVCVLPALLS